ncbi:unnamed protein product [Notodromas monacha]|uniref:Protein SON n=1 Tax=Notodromas monacha TaxID=399045 RepID=A0A7R9GB16_9CRUS|nr:unnamed protein product [Notodromas monacha]CAG0914570.1 unnamed protein product [Notodromas monacha]
MSDGESAHLLSSNANESSEKVLCKSSDDIIKELLESLSKEAPAELECPSDDGSRSAESEEPVAKKKKKSKRKKKSKKKRKHKHSDQENDENDESVGNFDGLPCGETSREASVVKTLENKSIECSPKISENPQECPSKDSVSNEQLNNHSEHGRSEDEEMEWNEVTSPYVIPIKSRSPRKDRKDEKQTKSKSDKPREKSSQKARNSEKSKSSSRKRSERSSKSSNRRRGRSPKKHSSSSSKSRRKRSRSRSPRKSSHRSSKPSRTEDRGKKRESSSEKKETKAEYRIDKERLLRIAQERLMIRKEQEQKWLGPRFQPIPETIPVMANVDKSVDELTAVCRRLVAEDDDTPVSAGRSSKLASVVHPYQVKDRPLPSIVLNIRNATQLPTNSHQDRTIATLEEKRLLFPVSSGQDHREHEARASNLLLNKPSFFYLVSDVAERNVNGDDSSNSTENKSVFDIQPRSGSSPELSKEKMKERMKKNSKDLEAMNQVYPTQERLPSRYKSHQLPGQFTGSTGVKPLTYAELNQGPQAWARPDQFVRANRVTEGPGRALLERMGWKEGEGLGKSKAGPLEPLTLDIKTDKRGLGIPVKRQQPSCQVQPRVRPNVGGIRSNTSAKPLDFAGKHPVSILMEMCSKNHWEPPIWETQDSGPPHLRVFITSVTVRGQTFTPEQPVNNKKQSRHDAALECLKRWGLIFKTA